MSIDPERYQINQPSEGPDIPEGVEQQPTPSMPPSRPKVKPTFALLSLIERGVYTQAGLPPQIIKQIEDPDSRQVVADTLEMLGLPKALLNVDGLSPTMRWILMAGVLGGYGYLVYSQAKNIKKAIMPAPLPAATPAPQPASRQQATPAQGPQPSTKGPTPERNIATADKKNEIPPGTMEVE